MDTIKVYCRSCGRPTNHKVCFNESRPASDSHIDGDSDLVRTYQTVECAGCETISFREQIVAKGEVSEHLYPPRMLRAAKNYFSANSRVPEEIAAIYQATMDAFNHGAENPSSFILCAGGMRCMLELICDDLNMAGSDLLQKINGLYEFRHLTESHTRLLQDARFLGNDALHRGIIPNEANLNDLLNLFEDTINDLYIRPERFDTGDRLKGTITGIKPDGIEVRIGRSTRIIIGSNELGIDNKEDLSRIFAIKQIIDVVVLSAGLGETPVLSKRKADQLRKEEETERRRQEEERRVRREALLSFKSGDLLEGTVNRILQEGAFVNVTKGDITAEGWIPVEESGASANRPITQILRRGNRITVLVTKILSDKGELYLSKKRGDFERAWRRAEDSFREKSLLEGKVIQVAPDGKRLILQLGMGCRGQLHISQIADIAENSDNEVDLKPFLDQTLPVCVTSPVSRERVGNVVLSHRAAIKRKKALTDSGFSVGTQYIGKVGNVFPWGTLVTINGIASTMKRSDMGSRSPSNNDEVTVRVIQCIPDKGILAVALEGGNHTDIDEEAVTEEDMFGDDEDYSNSAEQTVLSIETEDSDFPPHGSHISEQ